jgi:hypothetical protein
MKAGHTFTIEPMINAGPSVNACLKFPHLTVDLAPLGTYRDYLWPDDWTVATVVGPFHSFSNEITFVSNQPSFFLSLF